MKGTVKIIAGKYRGKIIPFLNSRYGDADITPQKVKGALFSILGEHLEGKVVIDLFSGSGQIGIEALSRGADSVIFNEDDRSRYSFIRDFIKSINASEKAIILNMKADEALVKIAGREIMADIVFIDPPYEKVKGEAGVYNSIIEKINETGVLKNDGVIIVQHFSSNILPDKCSSYTRSSIKKYGTTSLSVYSADLISNQPEGF